MRLFNISVLLTLLTWGAQAFSQSLPETSCSVLNLSELRKPVIDRLGSATATLLCANPAGQPERTSIVTALISERNFETVRNLLLSENSADFALKGIYGASQVMGIDGVASDWSELPASRSGVVQSNLKTIFTFRDVPLAVKRDIFDSYRSLGALKLEDNQEGLCVTLLSTVDGVGELVLAVFSADIEEKSIPSGRIDLADGRRLSTDQIVIKGESAMRIAGLMVEAGMATSSGRTEEGAHYPFKWDYVYFGSERKPLFHCANIHSVYEARCFIGDLRLK